MAKTVVSPAELEGRGGEGEREKARYGQEYDRDKRMALKLLERAAFRQARNILLSIQGSPYALGDLSSTSSSSSFVPASTSTSKALVLLLLLVLTLQLVLDKHTGDIRRYGSRTT